MKRGFTLLETIFASVLFAFVILFVLNLYPGSMVAIHRGESQIVADNFAQTILEDLRSRSYANVNPSSPPTYAKLVYANTEYTPVLQVTYKTDPPVIDPKFLKVATLKVQWNFQNRNQEVTHVMYLHNVTR